jgi:hypothetical protein
VVLLVAAASVASAAPRRVPQVAVSGTALADYFASVGENIDVHHDQLDLQTLSLAPGVLYRVAFQVSGYTTDSGDTLGVYSNHVLPPTPERYVVLPGDLIAAPFELHASASFKSMPSRLTVTWLDVLDNPVGARTYFAGPPDGKHFGPPDPSDFGFYIQRSDGSTFYQQDARNPGGAPRILVFAGTGSYTGYYYTGYLWFACETGTGSTGDFADFADFIALADLNQASIVPVNHTSWGALKQRFR